MHVGVVGAGVNGICSAIAIAEKGHKVTVYDSGEAFSETSSKSSRMFHGGIRYLEQGHFALVKEALRERKTWAEFCPGDTQAKRFFIPIYRSKSRSRAKLFFGVKLYELLSGGYSFGKSFYHSKKETLQHLSYLKDKDLLGSVSYVDVVFDDVAVSQKLISRLEASGGLLKENITVTKVSENGEILFADGSVKKFDRIVNAAGPWSVELLKQSRIHSEVEYNLIKGSHLILDYEVTHPAVFQVGSDQRIIFLIPNNQGSILGTTEVPHSLKEKAEISASEIEYLLKNVNSFLIKPIGMNNILSNYSGLRPVIKYIGVGDPGFSQASRESKILMNHRLANIFGGKWTSALLLGEKVAQKILENK